MKIEFDSYDALNAARFTNEDGVLIIADYEVEWLDEKDERGLSKKKYTLNGKCRAIVPGDKYDYWNDIVSIDFENRTIKLTKGEYGYDNKYNPDIPFTHIHDTTGRKRKLKGFPHPPKVVPTTFEDFRGTTCKFGDNVVFVGKGGNWLDEGVVVKITEKQVLIEYTNTYSDGKSHTYTFRTFPNCIVKA